MKIKCEDSPAKHKSSQLTEDLEDQHSPSYKLERINRKTHMLSIYSPDATLDPSSCLSAFLDRPLTTTTTAVKHQPARVATETPGVYKPLFSPQGSMFPSRRPIQQSPGTSMGSRTQRRNLEMIMPPIGLQGRVNSLNKKKNIILKQIQNENITGWGVIESRRANTL